MIADIRNRYNQSFNAARYDAFVHHLDSAFQFPVKFRVAESPVFVPRSFQQKLDQAVEPILDFLLRPDYRQLTEGAIPPAWRVPNETAHTLFLALDFAIVRTKNGELVPQLIEMQGFPSLFGFQDFLASQYRAFFDVPPGWNNHFIGSSEEYRQKLQALLLGGQKPEHVVLLEINPLQQNTAIDFVITEKMTGIPIVNLADVEREGRYLFYRKEGKRIRIHRIYNRVIVDELVQHPYEAWPFSLTQEVDVEWAGHPNWFFRISKYTMPFLQSPYIPECRFLSQIVHIPDDLENYVLKPLFSFSGSGVIFHVTAADIEAIPEAQRSHYLLQRKVLYEPVIQAPDGGVKAEIRLLYWWPEGTGRPQGITNLARLSRGEMIGVKFNKDKTWVGGSVCFFEP